MRPCPTSASPSRVVVYVAYTGADSEDEPARRAATSSAAEIEPSPAGRRMLGAGPDTRAVTPAREASTDEPITRTSASPTTAIASALGGCGAGAIAARVAAVPRGLAPGASAI